MQRSAAKTQADKRRRGSSAQATTPPEESVEVEDIVPGCLTKTQWTDLLLREDSDDIVGEIMEELLSKVLDSCFKVYIKRQVVPYSASWAKSFLTKIVEQQILCVGGEGPGEAAKIEDTEPLPSISDTWVPVLKVATPRPQPTVPQEADTEVSIQKEPCTNQQYHNTVQTRSSLRQSEEQTSPRRPLPEKHHEVFTPRPPPKMNRKKVPLINTPPKPVQNELLPPLSCSAEKEGLRSGSRNARNSASSNMTESFSQKDPKPIPKLDPSCLPRHFTFPQIEILDNNSTKPFSTKPSRLSKLEPRSNKHKSEWPKISLELLSSSKDESANFQRKNEADIRPKKMSSLQREEGVASSRLFRPEKMDLAKGVSILDSHTVAINSVKLNPLTQSTNLRPIQREAALPLFSVDQVITGQSSQITPLVQFRN
ncbi:uncharacterized protein LOC117819383 [Xyrichtys novacula]|uniref:Uncharacterized protein LOC117819383 n=1 Tax=Xyrichtys novacula TaxID=13765 RepID=A0AAV1G6L2_XYRNO|nr:uncharacterized protein LOC117819383 [Xyrichtys novacula]